MADEQKPTPPAAGTPGAAGAKSTVAPESTTLGGGSVTPPVPAGAQQAHTAVQQQAAVAAGAPASQVSTGAGNKRALELQKRIQDAQKALDDAKAEYASVSAAPETSAADDQKQAQQFFAAQTQQQGLSIVGRAGGPFNIDGSGFGDKEGQILVGGRVLTTTRWNDKSIKGQLPADLGPGDIVLRTAAGTEIKGKYPTPTSQAGQQQVVVTGTPVR